jgi:hypothetical protein
MSKLFSELTISAQTAYAQLFDAALSTEHMRSVADLSGSFNAKSIRAKTYWYFQYTEPSGHLRQIYVGPDSDAVRRLIERKSGPAISASLIPLARSAMALGCEPMNARQFRLVKRLSEYGFFRAGGVLIGTHAFIAYANMLGVHWGQADRTQDIDFAHAGKSLSLLLPSNVEVETSNAIESLDMGFLPVLGLSGKSGGAYLIPKEPEFRLDFLTTLHRKGDEPFEHPQFHVTFQPLRFMEFPLEGIEQAVLFCNDGAVVVNIPDPARYALHKLLVYAERSASYRAKASKDVVQAAHLLAFLWESQPEHLEELLHDLIARGKGWRSRFRDGSNALKRQYPDQPVSAHLVDALSASK